jgi:uncharacterized protein with HEPN domain
MYRRLPRLLVDDILSSCQKILAYTEGMSFEGFIADNKTLDAVIRNFEIIGEAANRLPETFKENHPGIDWHRIRGFRNRIVHDYMGIDYGIVWDIRENFLETLIIALQAMDTTDTQNEDTDQG